MDFIARNAGLLRAARENERAMRQQRRVARSAGRAAGQAAVGYTALAVAASAALVALGQQTRRAIESARELDTFSAATGATVRELQTLEAAGTRVGLTFDDVSDVLQTFTESVGLARRGLIAGTGGAQLDALRFLGFSREEILAAENDVVGLFDRFFARLRSRSQAEAQEILGEFSLPDQARRLIALDAGPIQAGIEVNLPQLDRQQVRDLNRLFARMAVTGLRLERQFQALIATNTQPIDDFLDALERNTPAMLSTLSALAGATGTAAQTILNVIGYLERRFGSGQDAQTGEPALTSEDIIDGAFIAATIFALRNRIRSAVGRAVDFVTRSSTVRSLGQIVSFLFNQSRDLLLRFLLRGASFANVGGPAAPQVLTQALRAMLGFIGRWIARGGIYGTIAYALDQALLGGTLNNYITDFVSRLYTRLFAPEAAERIEDEIDRAQQGQAGLARHIQQRAQRRRLLQEQAGIQRGPIVPEEPTLPADTQQDILNLQRMQNQLLAFQRLMAADTQRNRALNAALQNRIQQIQDEITTLQQAREVGELDDQSGQALRNALRTKALEELRAATREQGLALSNLRDTDFIREANQQFILGLESQVAELQQQIAIAVSPEAQRLRVQIEGLTGELEGIEAIPFDPALFIARRRRAIQNQIGEAQALLRLSRDDAQFQALGADLARIQEELSQTEQGNQLQQAVATFPQLADQRRRNAELELRLSTLRTQEAAEYIRSLARLRQQEQLSQRTLENAQLEEQILSFQLPEATALRRYNQFLQDSLSTFALMEEIASFVDRAPARLQQEQLRRQLNILQLRERVTTFPEGRQDRLEEQRLQQQLSLLERAENAQFRVNNLAVEYFDLSLNALSDLLTSARSLADVVRGIARQALQITTRATLEALLTPAISSLFGQAQQAATTTAASGALPAGGGQAVAGGQFAGKATVEALDASINRLQGNLGALAVSVDNNTRAAGKAIAPAQEAVRGQASVAGIQRIGIELRIDNIDARGGDEASIQRGIARATPGLVNTAQEGILASLASSELQRDRFRRSLEIQ